jgi:hypothetical protein
MRLRRKWRRDIDYRKKMVVDTTGAAIWATPETAEILKVS